MLGPAAASAEPPRHRQPGRPPHRLPTPCHDSRRAPLVQPATSCDVSFDVHAGEVLGVVALEGQGQDELFDILCGQTRPGAGEMLVDGSSVTLRHPADAIRAGIVLVPADRSSALLMQRSVRENIALPAIAAARRWGPVNASAESRRVTGAIERLQIDTRAQSEARRLSGGNQQKVTIARWLGERRAHLPLLRPDARDRHRHQA